MENEKLADNLVEGRQEEVESDALTELLAWDGTIEVIAYVEFAALPGGRPAMKVAVRSLSSNEMDSCRENATMKGRNRAGRTIKDVDDDEFQLNLLFKSIQEPNLKNPLLQEKFNKSSSPKYILNNMFLPGEKDELSSKIFEASGYSMEEEIEMRKTDADLS